MSHGWDWKSGDWWILCDSCQKKIKASESRKRWDGLIVCADDWEYRHPQDFIKAQKDKISVPFSRPRPTDTFVPVDYTSYPSESFLLDDSLSKDFTMVVPDSVEYFGDSGDQSLGANYLGQYPLAGDGTFKGYNSRIGFSESVTLAYEFLVSPTDSIGFSETFVKQDDEVSGSDSMSFTEGVVVNTFINKALGVQVLGSITLG